MNNKNIYLFVTCIVIVIKTVIVLPNFYDLSECFSCHTDHKYVIMVLANFQWSCTVWRVEDSLKMCLYSPILYFVYYNFFYVFYHISKVNRINYIIAFRFDYSGVQKFLEFFTLRGNFISLNYTYQICIRIFNTNITFLWLYLLNISLYLICLSLVDFILTLDNVVRQRKDVKYYGNMFHILNENKSN